MSTVGFDLDDADLRPLFRDFDLVDLLSFEFESAVRQLRFCHSRPNPTRPRKILLRPAAGNSKWLLARRTLHLTSGYTRTKQKLFSTSTGQFNRLLYQNGLIPKQSYCVYPVRVLVNKKQTVTERAMAAPGDSVR